jgi:predicted aldo/keto reductase-like oxidoreductase
VGMVIMKPVNVGLTPAAICLPWLANQPIHVMAPGMSTLEHLELDVKVLDRNPMALTPEEEAETERWRQKSDGDTCRICHQVCQAVCEKKLNIDWLLYHNVFQNELRRLGTAGFLNYPFAPWVKERAEEMFSNTLHQLESCTRCGKCEEVCPHGLKIMDMLQEIRNQEAELLEALRNIDWAAENQGADTPFSKKALASWIGGGKKGKKKS